MLYYFLSACIGFAVAVGYGAYRIKKSGIMSLFMTMKKEVEQFIPGDGYATILYHHKGRQHRVVVPYDSSDMDYRGKFVYIQRGNKEINITQQHGVKYLLSPNELKSENIIVKDRLGDVLREVRGDEKL